MKAATSDEVELDIELDVVVDGAAQLCNDMDLGAPGVVHDHFDVVTADKSDELELNIELDVMVDGAAELRNDMDLGTPSVVRDHFDVPPSLPSSPLPSFARRVTEVVNLSVGVVDIRCIT